MNHEPGTPIRSNLDEAMAELEESIRSGENKSSGTSSREKNLGFAEGPILFGFEDIKFPEKVSVYHVKGGYYLRDEYGILPGADIYRVMEARNGHLWALGINSLQYLVDPATGKSATPGYKDITIRPNPGKLPEIKAVRLDGTTVMLNPETYIEKS